MSASGSRAAELAAQQVEQIVAAAQEAAEQIRAEAQDARKEARDQGKRDAERIRQKAKDESEAALMESRKQAVMMGQDARQEAEQTVKDAQAESERVREETRRAVEGRVAGAERAAAEVLKEAQALSGGLRQLGRSLEEQADRILRDVQAAHRRMQADLRVQSGDELPTSSSSGRGTRSTPAEPEPPPREAAPRRRGDGPSNPFDDLEVPGWTKK
jgi:hypothetical protein